MKKTLLLHILTVAGLILLIDAAYAQPTGGQKTIEVTSSFKPSLMKPDKPVFTPSPFLGDTARPSLSYTIPAQNLSFKFTPASLRPLAYQPDSLLHGGDRLFVKAGIGNLRGATLQAVAAFGDGENSNGQVNGYYDGAKGKRDFQQFAKYGIGVRNTRSVGNNRLDLNAGFDRHDTYRYGYNPDTLDFSKSDLRLNYNYLHAGAQYSNLQSGNAGLWYKAGANLHYFGDNNSNSEMMGAYEFGATKLITEKLWLSAGLEGMFSGLKTTGDNFSNNLTLIPVKVGASLTNKIRLHAGIIPSWNNGDFKLLPDLGADVLIKDGQYVLQLGYAGSYDRNTYQSLAQFNPWVAAPAMVTNTRRSELYGALKAVVDEQFSFRIKAGAGKLYNVPLFINDDIDGKSFNLVYDNLTNVNVEGELTYQLGQKFYWGNTLQVNSYRNLDTYDKAFGWLPVQFRSSARLQIMEQLYVNADIYAFSGTWYQSKGNGSDKASGGFDLNAGLSYQIKKKLGVWLDFRNMLNNSYQRWNQFPVVGFQVLGGVSFRM